MRRNIALKRTSWLGIFLMLLPLLAPLLTHSIAQARHLTPYQDEVCTSSADTEGREALDKVLHLSLCGYCDQAPAQFAGLPTAAGLTTPTRVLSDVAPTPPEFRPVDAPACWRRQARAPPVLIG